MFGDGRGITVFADWTVLMPELIAGRLKLARADAARKRARERPERRRRDQNRSDDLVGALVDERVPPLLSEYAAHVADYEVRQSATIGGNLCAPPGHDCQRGDLGAPLIALGARVRSAGNGGERTEPVEDSSPATRPAHPPGGNGRPTSWRSAG